MPRGPYRLAWGALAAGLFASLTGDIIYSLAPDLDAVPVPSASDPFWLAIYPCMYVALIALIRSRVGRTLWATRLDGLAGGLAIASVLACVTVSAAVEGSAGAPFWEEATNLAYPVGDLVLLGAIVSAVGLAGWRIDRLWATLGAAILALETADLIYMSELGRHSRRRSPTRSSATGMAGLRGGRHARAGRACAAAAHGRPRPVRPGRLRRDRAGRARARRTAAGQRRRARPRRRGARARARADGTRAGREPRAARRPAASRRPPTR